MENKDIISKIKEKAYENVNKKIEEQRKKTENKIKYELEVVSKCIDLINEKMIFKVIDDYTRKYVLATPDMFFEDYNKECNTWEKGIDFCDRKYRYEPYFKVNGEKYYDVRYIIGKYEEDFTAFSEKINRLYNKLMELENEKELMIKQQPIIKELLKQYYELHQIDEDEDEY